MDYSKRGRGVHQPEPNMTRALMTGIGSSVGAMLHTGAMRQDEIERSKVEMKRSLRAAENRAMSDGDRRAEQAKQCADDICPQLWPRMLPATS